MDNTVVSEQSITYHTVNIQNEPLKEQPKPKKTSDLEQMRLKKTIFDNNWKPEWVNREDLYFYKNNINAENYVFTHNNFVGAFMNAYNYHGDVVLCPDDIWIQIMMFLSDYIDKNSEELRSQFVNHDGEKKLRVIEYANSLKESLEMEKKWDFFFEQIIEKIKENTKEGITEEIECNFSTSDDFYRLVSTSIIMNSFKKYFSYHRSIMECAINNVQFMGTREDWVKLISMTQNLERFDVNGVLKKYVKHVVVILEKFLQTYDGKVDINFWNTIMTTNIQRIGSGGQIQTHIRGWILHFLGIYEPTKLEDVPNVEINVPIELYNDFTKETKNLNLNTNWCCSSQTNGHFYKPCLEVIMTYDNPGETH